MHAISLPQPGTQSHRLIRYLAVGASTRKEVELEVFTIIPDQVHAVARNASFGVERGEILAVVDDDADIRFPNRYRTLFHLLRGSEHLELSVPQFDRAALRSWMSGQPVLDARGEKLRRWQTDIADLIELLIDYTTQLQAWAEAGKERGKVNTQACQERALQLMALPFRPFSDWYSHMVAALHRGDLGAVYELCQLLLLRIDLEKVMFPLSHTLEMAKRRSGGVPLAGQLFPEDRRQGAAGRIALVRTALDAHTFENSLRDRGMTARHLREAENRLEHGELPQSKRSLGDAINSFDLLARNP